MDESSRVKTRIGERAGKCGCSRRDYLRHLCSAALDLSNNFQQTIIPGMRRRGPFLRSQPTILAVIVVQATEFQPRVFNPARELNDLVRLVLLDSGAIHARIQVKKDTDRAALPLPHLLFVFSQDGNADVGELIGYFAHAARVGTHQRIGDKHSRGAVAAGNQQLHT